jgi:hypothetical protein
MSFRKELPILAFVLFGAVHWTQRLQQLSLLLNSRHSVLKVLRRCPLGPTDEWRTQDFFSFGGGGGGIQQIQLRTEGRQNGDLGAVAP